MKQHASAALAPAGFAGHPIRRQVAMARRSRRLPTTAAPRGEDDLKLFALSFTAFFVCIYTLIF